MPFVTGFEGGLGAGKTLIMSAVPSKNAEQFDICLKTAEGDIALKFNPVFKKKEVCSRLFVQFSKFGLSIARFTSDGKKRLRL